MLSLADHLGNIDPVLAARLREAVPDGLGGCDGHLPLLRDTLDAVKRRSQEGAEAAQKILDALDNLPAHIGKRGRVWITQDRTSATYSAFWDEDDWLEGGPDGVSREAALAWAGERSDDIRLTELS